MIIGGCNECLLHVKPLETLLAIIVYALCI